MTPGCPSFFSPICHRIDTIWAPAQTVFTLHSCLTGPHQTCVRVPYWGFLIPISTQKSDAVVASGARERAEG